MDQQQFETPNETQKQSSVWEKKIMSSGTASIVFGGLSLFIFPYFFSIIGVSSGLWALKKGGREKTKGVIGIGLGIVAFGFYAIQRTIG